MKTRGLVQAALEGDTLVSQQLVEAIGSLTQLTHLNLACVPRHVSVPDCCEHLSRLIHLDTLLLCTLSPPPATDAASDADLHLRSGCVAMLSKMTRLQRLGLQNVGLRAREAMAVFSIAIPRLPRLAVLYLTWNQLRGAPCIVLANKVRALPALAAIYIAAGNELPGESESGCGTLNDLNWLAGRTTDVFF
jgi:hypothetical protein